MALKIAAFDVDVSVRRRARRPPSVAGASGAIKTVAPPAANGGLRNGGIDVRGVTLPAPPGVSETRAASRAKPSPQPAGPQREVTAGVPRFIAPPMRAPAPKPPGGPVSVPSKPAAAATGFTPMFKRLGSAARSAGGDGDVGVRVGTGSSGRALDEATRKQMEDFFAANLGEVRVHDDAHAAAAAASQSAEAFTIGQDIYFGAGKFDPASARGKALLGHELTHVLQRRGRGSMRQGLTRGSVEALEKEAQAVARRFETGGAEITVAGFVVDRYRCTYTTNRPPTEAERQRLEALSRAALKVCEDTLRAKQPDLLGAAARTLESVTLDIDAPLAGRSDQEVAQAWGRRLADTILTAMSRQAPPALAAAADAALKAPDEGQTAPQPAKANITITTQNFDVVAGTLAGAAEALNTRDEWGKTRWQVTYSYEATDGVVTSVSVTAKITIELPRWTALGKQPRRVQAEWNRMLNALRRHENEHSRIARERIDKLGGEMSGKPESELADVHAQCLQDLNVLSNAYDDRTNHGETEGVTLDLDVAVQPRSLASVTAPEAAEAEAQAMEHAMLAGATRGDVSEIIAGVGGGSPQIQRSVGAYDTAEQKKLIEEAIRDRDISKIKDVEPNAFMLATDTQAIEMISILLDQYWVGPRDELAIYNIWNSRGKGVVDLASRYRIIWSNCLDRGVDMLWNLPDLAPVKTDFKQAVASKARGYLDANKKTVESELKRYGLDNMGAAPSVEIAREREKMLQAAGAVKKAKDAIEKMDHMLVGYNHVVGTPQNHKIERCAAMFNSGGPPPLPGHTPVPAEEGAILPSWDDTKKNYDRAHAVIDHYTRVYPALVALREDTDLNTVATTGAVSSEEAAERMTAMQVMSKALNDTRENIDKTYGLVNDPKGEFALELQPLHEQFFLFDPTWQEPFRQMVARAAIKEHGNVEFWNTIGLAAPALALFVVAELTTGGLATFFFAAAAAGGVAQAAASWDKYFTLKAAAETNLSKETALISQAQANDQLVTAAISTVMAFLGAYTAASRGAKALADLAEAEKRLAGIAGEEALVVAEEAKAAKLGSGLPVHRVAVSDVVVDAKAAGSGLDINLSWDDPTLGTYRLGDVSVAVDAEGVPRATMSLRARVPIKGQEHAVRLVDTNGNEVALTRYAINETRAQYQAIMGREVQAFDGQLGLDNLRNFRLEFGRARARLASGSPATAPAELDRTAAQEAIRKISFGRHREAMGYADFDISLGDPVEVDFGGADGRMRVPSTVDVRAHLRPLGVAASQ